MLQFDRSLGDSQRIVVTLTELSVLQEPFYYLFVFTNQETKISYKKILSTESDISAYKYRYNEWIISMADVFNNAPNGHYIYKVYEQASNSDVSEDGKHLVENGRAIITPTAEFAFENYDTTTTYKSYNG